MTRAKAYGVLGLAALCAYFAALDSPVALAAWAAPAFLLRFTRRQGVVMGFVASLFALTVAAWLAAREMTPLPAIVLITLLIVCNGLTQLAYLADRLVHRRLPPVAASLVLPLGAVSADFALTAVKEGLTWWSPAYSQDAAVPLLQVLSVTGLPGIVFLLHWLAPAVDAAVPEEPGSRTFRPAIAFAAVLLTILVCGELRLARGPIASTVRAAGVVPPPDRDWLSVDSLQPPIEDAGALRSSVEQFRPASRIVQDVMFERTRIEAAAGARLIAWSEMAAWMFGDDETAFLARASRESQALGIELIVSIAVLRPGDARYVENKAVLLRPDGSIGWQYRKTHPVPGLEEAVTVPGNGRSTIASTAAGRVGAAICFDMDYPGTIRTIANGVDVLVVPSHDNQSVRNIHARMALFQAVSNGVTMFRPVADGVGLASDPYGRTLATVGYRRSGGASLVAQLPVRGVRTVYARFGNWFAWLCLAAWAGLIGRAITS
jgi:apolipoprotein N-acyltransferase